jgi:type IV secretion system protein VirB9
VRNVDYDPDQVVSIVGQFRHAIEIQFGPGETVTQAALGDTISWQIAPVGNIVFLKPREKAGGTNLIVVTNANGSPRTYHFNLVLAAARPCMASASIIPRKSGQPQRFRRKWPPQAARSVENGIVTCGP